MKKKLGLIFSAGFLALAVSACSGGSDTGSAADQAAAQGEEAVEESFEAEVEEAAGEAVEASGKGIISATTVAEVFGDGQKASAVILEYPGEIDPASLSTDGYEVEGQTIEAVYTTATPEYTTESSAGKYVIVKFLYENSESPDDTMGGGGNRGGNGGPGGGGAPDGNFAPGGDGEGAPEGGFKPDGNGEGAPDGGFMPDGDRGGAPDGEAPDGGGAPGQNMDGGMMRGVSAEDAVTDYRVDITQTADVAGVDGTVYPGGSTPVSSEAQVNLVLDDFKLEYFEDSETGGTIPYSVYLPEGYNENEKYPLLFFVADASANGDDLTRNLTQGNGAIIWATPDEQAKHPCVVVSPQYTNELIDTLGALTTDENIWGDGLTLVYNCLQHVIEEYSVDEDRIYGTGQSQGCMTNIALSDKYPDLFTAQFLVAGQWNTEEMAAMKDKKLWIVVSEGDTKAYPGMNAATELWESLGSKVARSDMWDSTSSPKEFDELVANMEAQNCPINYTVFENGSHMYTWSVAYNIEGIRDWIFSNSK